MRTETGRSDLHYDPLEKHLIGWTVTRWMWMRGGLLLHSVLVPGTNLTNQGTISVLKQMFYCEKGIFRKQEIVGILLYLIFKSHQFWNFAESDQ